MSGMKLEELTSPEYEALTAGKGAVIIPFGSLEAHGPHLPLGADTIQVMAVAGLVSERMKIPLAPAIPYGVCVSTRDHPGTVSIGTGTLKSLLEDLVRSFRDQGIGTFVIISGHAGSSHMAVLRDAGEDLLRELPDIRIVLISEYDLIRESGSDLLDTAEDRHAGELETSRVMHIDHRLVKGSAGEEYPSFPPHLLVRDKVAAWPGSVWGNPGAADPEKGRRLLERSVDNICGILGGILEE